jgi:hypothetical protein
MRPCSCRTPLAGAVVLALGLTWNQSASANTIVVNRCNDESGIQFFGRDLREGVAAAGNGDVVDLSGLACSTITLTIGEIAASVDDLTIKGPADHVLTIDAHNASRIFVQENFGGSLEIDSLRLYRGSAGGNGGCVFVVPSGNLTLTDSEVASCVASSFGGGVSAGFVTMTRTDLTGNVSTGGGGGGAFAVDDIYLFQSAVTSNNAQGSGAGLYANRKLSVSLFSVISGNTSTAGGGGGAIGKVTAEVRNSSITDNYSKGSGGGLIGGNTAIYGSVINGNTAGGPGGGVFAATSLKSLDSTFSGNTSQSGGGGGIYSTGWVYLRSNTIDGNIASGPAGNARGGGIRVETSTSYNQSVAVINSTISGNQANTAGGLEIHAPTNMVFLLGDTIAFNTVAAGLVAGANVTGCQINVWSSIIAKNGPSPFDLSLSQNCAYASIPPPSGDHNLIVGTNLPFFGDLKDDPKLAPLADNGGAVRTHALLPGSPAIDAGSNGMGLPYDSRGPGFTRAVGQADIGAFELQISEDRLFANGFETPVQATANQD